MTARITSTKLVRLLRAAATRLREVDDSGFAPELRASAVAAAADALQATADAALAARDAAKAATHAKEHALRDGLASLQRIEAGFVANFGKDSDDYARLRTQTKRSTG